jgi:phosphohistidine phosphatase SixA
MTFDVVSEVFQEGLFHTLTDLLYMGGFKELKEIFSIYSDELKEKNSVLIIGHNFGISDMVSILSGKKIYMDTADIKGVAIDVKDSWDNLLEYEGSWDLIYG